MYPNKKTILYLITQSELGGAQRYVFDLAKNFKNEFNIIVAAGEPGEAGALIKKLKQEKIAYYIIPHLKRAISSLNDFLALLEIIKLIKKTKPNIIHLNSSKISILGSLSVKILNHRSKILNLKLIYTVHGWVFNEPMPAWKKIFYKYAEKITAQAKNKLICVSEFDYQAAIKEKICAPKKLITIHNGIKPINFLTREQARQKLSEKIQNSKFKIYSKFKIQNSKFLVGSIGNLYETKGYEYLIKAAKKLTTANFNSLIIIIGEGQERKNLENLIKKLNLKNNIILIGRVPDAARLLPAFDIYISSSIKEGLPYTIIEAMAAGRPIIATRAGGTPELITHNKTGLLIKPANPKILAEKIKELAGNPTLARKLGLEAKIKAEKEFSLGQMLYKTKNVYR